MVNVYLPSVPKAGELSSMACPFVEVGHSIGHPVVRLGTLMIKFNSEFLKFT